MSEECLMKSVRELFSYHLTLLNQKSNQKLRWKFQTIRNAFYSRRQESLAIQGCHRKEFVVDCFPSPKYPCIIQFSITLQRPSVKAGFRVLRKKTSRTNKSYE